MKIVDFLMDTVEKRIRNKEDLTNFKISYTRETFIKLSLKFSRKFGNSKYFCYSLYR